MSAAQFPESADFAQLVAQQATQIETLRAELNQLRRTNECLCRDNADLKRGREALLARLQLLEAALAPPWGQPELPAPALGDRPWEGFSSSDRWLLQTSRADYTVLKQLLADQNWEAADFETQQLMLQIAGSEAETLGFLTTDQIIEFPCLDLKIINQLWRTYSNGHYGFTIQREIWAKTHSTRNLWVSPEFPGYYPKREGLGTTLAQRLLRCALDEF